jgi:hypothetical protein
MTNNRTAIKIKQSTLIGKPQDLFNDLIEKYPTVHELKEKRTMDKEEIRGYLIKNKEYELKRLKIERMYEESDMEITAKELMEDKISIRKFSSGDSYIRETAQITMNTAGLTPGLKAYQVLCNGIKIGVFGLANVLLSTTPRNKIFPESLDKQDGLNLQICISYPWSGKFLVGKLLATLGCTMTYLQNKDYMETTSLYGKSVQYDRLPFLRYLGLTSGGLGAKYLFPHQFYLDLRVKLKNFINHYSVEGKSYHDKKQQQVSALLKLTGLWDEGYRVHNLVMRRGYYICYMNNRFKGYEAKRLPPKTYNEAIDYWRNRWLVKRMDR